MLLDRCSHATGSARPTATLVGRSQDCLPGSELEHTEGLQFR